MTVDKNIFNDETENIHIDFTNILFKFVTYLIDGKLEFVTITIESYLYSSEYKNIIKILKFIAIV